MAHVPEHPLVSDTAARAVVRALVECELIGVALVTPPAWAHAMVSTAYETVLGVERALGRSMEQIDPSSLAFSPVLHVVAQTGNSAYVADVAVASGGGRQRHASLTFLRVHLLPADGVLVLARDVTEQLRVERTLNHVVALASELAAGHELPQTILAATARGAEALEADSASIFFLSTDATHLEGAFDDWAAARTSLASDVEAWPTVKTAMATASVVYFTRGGARGAEVAWFEHRGIAATVCAPLIHGNDVLGVMFFDFEAEPRGDAPDKVIARGIADQCASALAGAKASISAAALRILWKLPAPKTNGG